MAPFTRLIRFQDALGAVHYGEAGDLPWDAPLEGQCIPILDSVVGDDWEPWDPPATATATATATTTATTTTTATAIVAKLLTPIAHPPVIFGTGLTYRTHAEEANYLVPTHPIVFSKNLDTLAGPFDDIPIGRECQTMLDYEGELVLVMGKDAKDLAPDANPLDYVLGYMAGNDITSRFWSRTERWGTQPGYAKSFDKFAPLGHALVSTAVVPDPSVLRLKTWVNGQLRQNTGLDALLFDVSAQIRHLSRGRTLRKGTVIMTGTPGGIAAFQDPPAWLQDGDVVEVELFQVGRVRNRIVFDK